MSIPKLKKIKSEKKYHDLTLSDEYAWVDQPNILEVLKDASKLDTEVKDYINANNKMIARLSALRYILNTLEYDEKKTLEPPKWGEDLGQYSCYIEGVLFDNLNYEQYKILAPFSD